MCKLQYELGEQDMAHEPLLRILAPGSRRVFIHGVLNGSQRAYPSKSWWAVIDHRIQVADRYGWAPGPAGRLFHATCSEGK
jgi:hypothetical protein